MEATKQLYAKCTKRAYDVLNRRADQHHGGKMSTYKPEPLHAEQVQWLVAKGLATSIVVSAAAFFVAIPPSRRSFGTAIASFLLGDAVGAYVAVAGMPDAVAEVIRKPEHRNVVADEMICPAVREFEPCAADSDCRALMASNIMHCLA
jgi:hypothetical protein